MDKPLSPAAQAVLDAFLKAPMGQSHVDDDLIAIAAALQAAADQVVPDEITWQSPIEEHRYWPSKEERAGAQDMACVVRRKLLAIAAELEGAND
jgi:hypothetical protein